MTLKFMNKLKILFFVYITFCGFLFSQDNSEDFVVDSNFLNSEPVLVDGIYAVVGSHVIFHSDINNQMFQYQTQGTQYDDNTSLRQKVIDELFLQKLLLHSAALDSIEIDGVAALGDGWAPSETLLSDCVSNPYSCDVVGAFLDNICVGWVYADAEGFTTLPIMGASQIDGDGTASYCIQGDIPSIKIYDSSSGAVLDVVAGDAIPAWSDNIAYQISNISFANNGIIADGPNWTYFQSSNQAFYIFENIVIDDIVLEDFDIVGAFKDGLCVGWINYDTDGFTSVPVMGFEEGLYPNYMLDSEIPYFRFFDYSDQAYYNIILISEVPGWSSNSYFIIEGDTVADLDVIEGCTDVNACNYEPSATDDDGSCLYNDCAGECGGLAELDDCGVCQGDGASCLASLQLGLFDELGSLEILYDFGGPVAGFQFDLTGLELVGASGGVADEIGMTVSTGATTIIGFSLDNVEILEGSGVLTIVSFSDVIDGQTLLTLGNFGAITDAEGNVYVTNAFGFIDHLSNK